MYRRRRKTHPLFVLLIIFVVICSGFFIAELILRNTLVSLAESQAKWKATEAVHRAILEEIGGEARYEDLMHIEKDKDNNIILMQANIIKINRLSSGVAMNVQRQFEELKTEKFDIPLGQLTDSNLLASYGPQIGFRLLPVGTVEVTAEDSFEDAGINQTQHKIYLNVNSSVKVVIPLVGSVVDVSVKIPVADAVIVGEVPDTFIEFSGGAGQGFFK